MGEYPIGNCPSCGGKRIWIDRSFNPYPKWAYIHKKGCLAGKRWSEEEQVKETGEFGACPVHGLEPALECRTCIELADRDDWLPNDWDAL